MNVLSEVKEQEGILSSKEPDAAPVIQLPPPRGPKLFKFPNAFAIENSDNTWTAAVVDTERMTIDPIDGEKPLSILYMTAIDWEDPSTAWIELEDAEMPIRIRFSDREASEQFKPYCVRYIRAVAVANRDSEALECIEDPGDQTRNTLRNVNTAVEAEINFDDTEEKKDFDDMLEVLRNSAMRKLPSIEVPCKFIIY